MPGCNPDFRKQFAAPVKFVVKFFDIRQKIELLSVKAGFKALSRQI